MNSILTNIISHLYQAIFRNNKARENSKGHLVQSLFPDGSKVVNYEKCILEKYVGIFWGRLKEEYESHIVVCVVMATKS